MSVRRTLATALATLLLVLATGCTGGSEDGPDGGGPPGSGDRDARVVATIGRVTGDLDRDRRAPVRDAVRRVVQRWFAAAYVGGDWPRRGTARAYPGFTRSATEQARADRALTSNAVLGPRLDDVVARRGDVVVDVLATAGRPRAATARFDLRMALSGELERTDRVTGSLFLVPGQRGWQVTGYDVRRGTERGSRR